MNKVKLYDEIQKKRLSYAIYYNVCLALLAVQLSLIVLTTREGINRESIILQKSFSAPEAFLKDYR